MYKFKSLSNLSESQRLDPRILSSVNISTGQFYQFEILHPTLCSSNSVIRKRTHIFTENELLRAVDRYTVEREQFTSDYVDFFESYRKVAVGYMNVLSYCNRNGVIVTRYAIRLDLSCLKTKNAFKDGSVICLFTAREIRRSLDRRAWMIESLWNNPLRKLRRGIRKLLRCIRKIFRNLYSSASPVEE